MLILGYLKYSKMGIVDKIKKHHLCLGCGLCETIDKGNSKRSLTVDTFYTPVFSKVSDKNDIIKSICLGFTILSNNKQSHKSIW